MLRRVKSMSMFAMVVVEVGLPREELRRAQGKED